MIDDDCALPANFPIVTERMTGRVKCMGYTIKSVGPESSKGTLCQQAQDLEYKLSGIQRAFAGKLGSATFAHGAIGLWDREFLVKVFYQHPGFSVSEDCKFVCALCDAFAPPLPFNIGRTLSGYSSALHPPPLPSPPTQHPVPLLQANPLPSLRRVLRPRRPPTRLPHPHDNLHLRRDRDALGSLPLFGRLPRRLRRNDSL